MKKRLRMNPILKKELMVGSRSIKMSMAIFGINAILTLIVIIVMATLNYTAEFSGYEYSSLLWLFPILGCAECGLISLIVPIITSGSISGERERQTLDIMLTTPLSPFSIAVGKLASAMAVVMMYMISSIPILAISFVLGGMSWWALLGLLGMLFYLGIYVGSIGVFCSSVVKKSIMATVLTIMIGILIIVITMSIFYGWQGILTFRSMKYGTPVIINMAPLSLMLNPYSPIFDFMVRTMSSSSIYDMVIDTGTDPKILLFLYRFWIPISMFLNLLISFGFLKLAAVKICATKNRKQKKG